MQGANMKDYEIITAKTFKELEKKVKERIADQGPYAGWRPQGGPMVVAGLTTKELGQAMVR